LEERVPGERPPLDAGQFISGYLVEVDEHLASATRNLLAVDADLKRQAASPRAIRELYRSLHTIKGLSAMVGFEPLVEIAHAMENVLREADAVGGKLNDVSFDLLMKGLSALEQRVRAVSRSEPIAAAPTGLLRDLSRVQAPAGRPDVAAGGELTLPPEIGERLSLSEREQLLAAIRDGRRAVRIDLVPTPAGIAAGFGISAVRERVAALGEIVKVVPLPRPVTEGEPGGLAFALLAISSANDRALTEASGASPQTIGAIGAPAALPPPMVEEDLAGDLPTGGSQGVVRVEVARLDDALDKLSALIVTRFRLERAVADLAEKGADVRALRAIAQENGRQIRDLRAAIMKARMVSAAELFQRVPLLVRRLAGETGKKIHLELEAGRAELDKAVGERIFPAIVHLIRNAVDHGLEQPDDRRRLGKPEEGRITLSCQERGNNQLEIAVADDGRGMDGPALARRAGKPAPRSDDELLALVTLPGVSTRQEVSTTSGRGMGMEIVKRVVVEELGGTLAVRSTPQQGTSFQLRLPLTITIIDAFSFRCGAQAFVVPVAGVEEIVEIDPAQVVRAPSGKGRAELRMIERRGAAVPLVSLESLFHLAPLAGVRANKAILIRRAGQLYGFEVDRMMGQQEVVVRPLADPLVKQPGIVGSTDLGDGQPTLVLDLFSLSAKLSRRKTDLRP
jgi:two-component system chemotaxis sensor kinase CheA